MALITSASPADTRGDFEGKEMAMQGRKGKKRKWLTLGAALVAAIVVPLADAGIIGPQAAEIVDALAQAVGVRPAEM